MNTTGMTMEDSQHRQGKHTQQYADTPKHMALRAKLADEVASQGIKDARVIEAIRQLPRHLFMPAEIRGRAYEDKALPIGEGQTISQPYTVAYQTQLLSVQPGDKILEVGTGSAYQAAILAVTGARVYTIERQKKLYDRNQRSRFLQQFQGIHYRYGDGFLGWPEEAPFDKILITAAPEEVPASLIGQLRVGGLLVAPVGKQGTQQMVRITKEDDGQLNTASFDYFSFVPMLKGKA
ncbi:protein-L-isoaspartate(D-aspartate) O-methyltransferase [Chitinophaga agri]|nr:protein-L-isoaspartate(D-aspartate) O-methyltransferase [Chitinophaga agri]